jgi:arylsulfatase A-like enzyme/Tfp pilus assembly protein PilF
MALAGAAVALVLLRPARSATGVAIGRLPFGVSAGDLNLLVVTLDTTRADRLGPYGYAGAETPTLDRLAREGVVFEQAVTSAPLTLPSHSTMFTGQVPPVHGVRDNGGFFLDPGQVTLAERLHERGFRTAAFVAAYVLDSKWGLDQGFDTYVDEFDLSKHKSISLGAIQRPANEVVDRALAWLDQHSGGRFFTWVHLYDPHAPYEAPEPYASRHAGRPYDGEIAFTDAQVGRLVARLDDRGLLDRTVVMVIGDHGESLTEHGEGTHGFFIYEGVARVPFIVRAPYSTMRGKRIGEVVRSVDLLATALELVGLPPPGTGQGTSLVPLMTGAARDLGLEAYAESLYPLHHFGWSDLRLLRDGRYKLIAAPRPELYDLQTDPHESQNLFESRRALGDRMIGRLRELEAGWAEGQPVRPVATEIDPDARARLAALGYVGSFVTTAAPDENRTGLADPKDKIDVFNRLHTARDLSNEEGKFEEAVATVREVLAEDPTIINAWFMLGNLYVKENRQEEAIPCFQRVLALKPDYEMAIVNMANAYRHIGKEEEALVGYRRYLELDPRSAQVRYQTAQILIDRGELDEAAGMLRAALETEPKLAAARNALGVIALRTGDPRAAEREIRAAIDQRPDVRLAHFNLALLAEERGDLQTALAEYRREIELHPTSYKAQFNLGRLYERLGDRQAQADAFGRAIEINPYFSEGHIYLAKLYLDTGQRLDEAARLARRGIELNPRSTYAALGHYVLADVLNRQGRHREAEREAALGRAAEARHGRKGE